VLFFLVTVDDVGSHAELATLFYSFCQ